MTLAEWDSLHYDHKVWRLCTVHEACLQWQLDAMSAWAQPLITEMQAYYDHHKNRASWRGWVHADNAD